MRVKILWLGKTKNTSIRALTSDYLERIGHVVPCEIVEARDPAKARHIREGDRIAAEAAELSRNIPGSSLVVALDESGKQLTSLEFARWFENEQNRGTREVLFVIGGAEGLSPQITRGAGLVLSLGKMTWTHEMCRALLLEQVYRAFSILKNLPYHK